MAGLSDVVKAKYVAIFYLLAFIVTVVMLFTDRNLQSDFGALNTTPPYFIHWYGLLVTAIIDLVAATLILVKLSRRMLQASGIGSVLMAAFLAGDILSYKSVGFQTAQQFATYLFGLTPYQGNTNYIPGLYTLLFVLYIVTFIVSIVVLSRSSKSAKV